MTIDFVDAKNSFKEFVLEALNKSVLIRSHGKKGLIEESFFMFFSISIQNFFVSLWKEKHF